MEEWVKRCLECTHSYKKQDDADTIYCRLKKGCKFDRAITQRDVVTDIDGIYSIINHRTKQRIL